jgi:lysophospholipase L1-like esterase
MKILEKDYGKHLKLGIIDTDKFKTDYFSMSFMMELSEYNISNGATLAAVLGRGTEKYKNITEINRHLMSLYDADIGAYTVKTVKGLALRVTAGMLDGSFALDYNTDTAAVIYSTDGKKGAVSVAAQERKPQYVIITLGLENGVAHCSKEKFQEYYSKIIDAIKKSSPETKIILQSVFPTSKQVSKDKPSISCEKISIANSWIAELAQSKSVKYLNTASVLTDKRGNLKSEYDSGDGIHLNTDGYTAVLDYIRTHGYK